MTEQEETNNKTDSYNTGTVFDYTKKRKVMKAAIIPDEISPQVLAQAAKTFDELSLHDTVKNAVGAIGWAAPTPVQGMCLPITVAGRDVAGFAQTGTGKTGVFLITIAQRLLDEEGQPPKVRFPRAIVLAPTRELAMQISEDAIPLLNGTGLESLAVFGGVDYDKQARKLKDGTDVIVATPGRLKDYCKKGLVDLSKIDIFICDEADRMFDMGFIEDVEYFLEKIPEDSQKLLFSATTNPQVKELAFEYLNDPEYISINPEEITPEAIEQRAIHVNSQNKLPVLLGLLRDHNPTCAIIFTNTKLTAEWLQFKLQGNGFESDLMSGDLPQSKRIRLIKKIKEGQIKALIATDVASRGLHISQVTHVYNFDLPEEPANYIHRIGRTARAGAKGVAVSLVCDDYGQNWADINELLGEDGAVTTEWYDESYLEIEDKAGNPFEKKPEDFDERPRRDDRPRRDKPQRGGPKGRAQAAREDRSGGSKEGGSRNAKGQGQGRGRQGNKGRGKQGDRPGGQDRNKPRSAKGHSQDNRQKQGQPQAAAAAAAPASVGGLFKKMVKTIFGRS